MEKLITRKGNPNKPPRVMIYGVEGVGKSTFGARAENPVFISPEGGVDRLRTAQGQLVDEMPGIATWDDVKSAIKALTNSHHDFKTVVLDSSDWLEKLCHTKIVGNSGKSIITANGGYGAGYRQSEIMHKELIEEISQLRDKRNMNVIITAHAHVKAVKDPSMLEDYDSFEIKSHEMVSSLWREWVDALIFVRFATFIKGAGEETAKARAVTDGSRVAYTVKQPSFQAKNRYGLPSEMTFTENFWNEFITHVRNIPESQMKQLSLDELKTELNSMWTKITNASLKATVQKAVIDAGDDETSLKALHKRLREVVATNAA